LRSRTVLARVLSRAAALTVCAVLTTTNAVSASVTSSNDFAAPFVQTPPPLDPAVHSPVWDRGIVVTGFTNVLTKAAATQETRAWLLFDLNNLYVRIESSQPDQKITTNPQAQNFGQADFAGVGIAPSGDAKNVYYFGATPTGHQYVLNSRDAGYAPQWIARSSATETTWTTVLVIPFNVLIIPQSVVQKWRINVVRHVAQTDDDLTWAYNEQMRIPSSQIDSTVTVASAFGGANAQAQAQGYRNALNAQNAGENPLGLAIWPTTADAPFWPTVSGRVPTKPAPVAQLSGAALLPAGLNRNLFSSESSGGNYVPQGIPYLGYAAGVRIAPTVVVGVLNNEIPLLPNVAQLDAYQLRPFFTLGGDPFLPSRFIPSSTLALPDTVIATWNVGEITHGYRIAGSFGTGSFNVSNVVGQGMNDTLMGVRDGDQQFNYWLNGALTDHSAGYLGSDARIGTTQSGEFGVGGRDPKTGLAYIASYALEGGNFSTLPPPVNHIDPGLASKTELVFGVEQPFYTAHAVYTNIGSQFAPADGSVNVAGVRGLAFDASATGAGAPASWIKQYYVRGYGVRDLDPSGNVTYADDEVSAYLLTKQGLNIAAGELLTTRSAYGYGTPYFPQVTGYPLNYIGPIYGKVGASGAMIGYKTGEPTSVNVSYMTGPNLVFTGTPTGVGYINGFQQTWTAFGQTALLGFRVQGAYGVNHGFYPGAASTLTPGAQNEGQTLRYAALSRGIDPLTSVLVGYQSVVGSPFGASAPDTYFSFSYVQNLRNQAGQFSVTYGAPPHAPNFAFARGVSNWNSPSLVFWCFAGNGLCNLNRLLVQYERTVNF
jgi:hypothetical protein